MATSQKILESKTILLRHIPLMHTALPGILRRNGLSMSICVNKCVDIIASCIVKYQSKAVFASQLKQGIL